MRGRSPDGALAPLPPRARGQGVEALLVEGVRSELRERFNELQEELLKAVRAEVTRARSKQALAFKGVPRVESVPSSLEQQQLRAEEMEVMSLGLTQKSLGMLDTSNVFSVTSPVCPTPTHRRLSQGGLRLQTFKLPGYKHWVHDGLDLGETTKHPKEAEDRTNPARVRPSAVVHEGSNASSLPPLPGSLPPLPSQLRCGAPGFAEACGEPEQPEAAVAASPLSEAPETPLSQTIGCLMQKSASRKSVGLGYVESPEQQKEEDPCRRNIWAGTKMELAMGLTPRDRISIRRASQGSPFQQCALRLVESRVFEASSVLVVVLSVVLLGWAIDHMARFKQERPPLRFHLLDVCCLAYFVGELLLRFSAYGKNFFTMWGWGFNALDLVLVVLHFSEEVLLVIMTMEADSVPQALLSFVHVFRAMRVLRIFSLVRCLEDLRLLVSCIMHSSRAFMWTLAFILLMVYVVAVFFTQIALLHQLDDSHTEPELERWFGNLPRSVLSLFQGLTGGVDWNDLVAPLIEHVSPWMGVVFCLYMSFGIISVMNVVTATFVQQAIERAAEVKERDKMSQANALFRAVDEERDGVISFEELAKQLESQEVKNFFRSIDVDLSEARSLFDMLDTDHKGQIQLPEFLSGCMRLQGPAKAIDLVLVMRNLAESFQRSLEERTLQLQSQDMEVQEIA